MTSELDSLFDALGTGGDVRQMLGLPFLESILSPAPTAEITALDTWWHEHAGEYPFGKLHRWGRTYEPDACD